MNATERIRRIVVALDASPQSVAALKAAAELAATLGAELVGIFVEDINLVRLGALSTVREVGAMSGRARQLDERRIQYELRGQAARARRAMERVGKGNRIRWSFRVARGSIEAELLEAASSADLMILGRAGWSGKRRLGSTAEAVLSARPRRTLLFEAHDQLQPTLMVIYDGSENSKRALDTAVNLAQGRGGYLAVGIAASDVEGARQLQSDVSDLLQPNQIEVRYRWLIEIESSSLGEILRTQEQCVLVLPSESPLLEDKNVREALQDFDCPVLVVG